MSTQDPQLMATLTDEERAAMADDIDDMEALSRIAGDAEPARLTGTGNDDPSATDEDDEDDEDDDGTADPNVLPIEGKPAADAPAETSDDTPATTTTQTLADQEPLPQRYRAELPADFDTRVAAISTRTAEVQQRFNDGEIDLAERDAELGTISTDRDELNRVRARVESLQEINTQNAQATWTRQIAGFMSSAATEQNGINYRTDATKAKDLDKYVKLLAADEDNAEKDGPWFLAEAHKLVKNKYGIADAPRSAAKTDAQKIAEARAARKPDLGGAPKTLAGVPGSEGPGDNGSEFADVESLEGQEYEDAIARMTPGQRSKFLAS